LIRQKIEIQIIKLKKKNTIFSYSGSIKYIKKCFKKTKNKLFLVVKVDTGGCFGFRYILSRHDGQNISQENQVLVVFFKVITILGLLLYERALKKYIK
jgi:Fe-S cluster assembly iron-binding protein IscA